MAVEPRGAFHRELDRLDIAMSSLLGLIPDVVRQATTAMLEGDRELAADVIRAGTLVEELYADVDETIEGVMARQAPVARDLRFLMCCVRLLPDVRETLELVRRIAAPEVDDLAGRISPRMQALTASMGARSGEMWAAVNRMWRRQDSGPGEELRQRDDALADAHSALAAEVAAGGLGADVAIEMAVLTVAYSGIAHHASQVARLIAGPGAGHPDDLH